MNDIEKLIARAERAVLRLDGASRRSARLGREVARETERAYSAEREAEISGGDYVEPEPAADNEAEDASVAAEDAWDFAIDAERAAAEAVAAEFVGRSADDEWVAAVRRIQWRWHRAEVDGQERLTGAVVDDVDGGYCLVEGRLVIRREVAEAAGWWMERDHGSGKIYARRPSRSWGASGLPRAEAEAKWQECGGYIVRSGWGSRWLVCDAPSVSLECGYRGPDDYGPDIEAATEEEWEAAGWDESRLPGYEG